MIESVCLEEYFSHFGPTLNTYSKFESRVRVLLARGEAEGGRRL